MRLEWAAAVALVPMAASAHPDRRIPVVWSDADCMTVIDRSASAIVDLSYEIPSEDTREPGDGEVADGRTHQFLALCDYPPIVAAAGVIGRPPQWLSQADVDAAIAAGAASSVDPESIMELNSAWDDCMFRITADGDRRPISHASASEGIRWDTSSLPAGAYTVHGYTWDPPINLWEPRPGTFKIVDDPSPASSGPAAAIVSGEQFLSLGEWAEIEGCVDAMPGTTMTFQWADVDAGGRWINALTVPVENGAFVAGLPAPRGGFPGGAGMVRVVVTDPQGRSHTAYQRDLVLLLSDLPDGREADDGAVCGGAACEPPVPAPGDSSSCTVSAPARRSEHGITLTLAGLLLAGPRRRRVLRRITRPVR